MDSPTPISTDVVLVGGGHTHALVLRQWAMAPIAGVRLTLITNLADTPYSGMLPSHIAGRYSFDESHIDLRPLTRFARCRLIMDEVVGLDVARQRVHCAHHPAFSYDVLSIDTGSTPATVTVPGAAEYAIAAKPVPRLLAQWQQWLDEIQARPSVSRTLAVVGGGVGGVELTLNLQERLHQHLATLGQPPERVALHLFHRGTALAADRNRWTRRRLAQIVRQRGIHLHLQTPVTALHRPQPDGPITLQTATDLGVSCDRVFWVTQAAAPAWLRPTGLALDERGFIHVTDTLQSCSHPNVFAAGDVATMVNHPRPKAGVFAVRQGKPLFQNLQRYLQGQPLRPFQPQRQYLNLIDVGQGRTLAARGPWGIESTLARGLKDRIDRKFMALFTDFPAMAQPPNPQPQADGPNLAPAMLCRGCGAKVGSDALSDALRRMAMEFPLPAVPAPLVGLTEPDDAAVVALPPGTVSVQTVDFFRAPIDDPFIFAQLCLKHCLSDLYAMGAQPHTVLAIVELPHTVAAKQADSLYPLLCGIQTALQSTGAQLVGGHTLQGAELGLGFACNGVADPQRLLTKGGLQVGHQLILTQAIGTGTLFAADQQGLVKGRWLEAALPVLVQSNQQAAQIVQHHGASACTDVTGFGLVGHLLEMVRAAKVGVELDLRQLPVLAGARQTLALGALSSLQGQNQRAANAIANAAHHRHHPDYPLLFDPQTAGGLLASLPPDQVDACLQALHQAGYTQATVVGTGVPLTAPEQPIMIRHW